MADHPKGALTVDTYEAPAVEDRTPVSAPLNTVSSTSTPPSIT